MALEVQAVPLHEPPLDELELDELLELLELLEELELLELELLLEDELLELEEPPSQTPRSLQAFE